MTKLRLIDLFCGAGGAAMGYSRAGFEVVGVDMVEQPRYPFEFHQADAMTFPLAGFDAIHASPPCHLYSTVGKQSARKLGTVYPDLVGPTRERLGAAGSPWVIENVVGAPLRSPVRLCGSWFGLDVQRHRLFETGGFGLLLVPPCSHNWQTPRFRSLDQRRAGRLASVVGVHGHENYAGENELRERAMGIDWMSPYELTQAIPPAYTEWIGQQLIRALNASANLVTGGSYGSDDTRMSDLRRHSSSPPTERNGPQRAQVGRHATSRRGAESMVLRVPSVDDLPLGQP